MKSRFREFIKFTASSLASTAVDLALFAFIVWLIRDASPTYYILIATTLARIVSIVVNYNINARLVFKDEDHRSLPFPKYIALAIVDMLASALFVTLIVNHIGWNETFVKMLVDGTLFFVGYLIQKFYIF